jgi:hypothetical protein
MQTLRNSYLAKGHSRFANKESLQGNPKRCSHNNESDPIPEEQWITQIIATGPKANLETPIHLSSY